jgi:protein-S-isoprenylcysteine O-methyltransferase Ste14/Co/Zn/Cd efflux system component
MSHRKSHHEQGQAWMMAAALLRGPRTESEIREHLLKTIRRFGLVPELIGLHRDTDAHWGRELDGLVEHGWALKEEGRFRLTETGRLKAETMMAEMRRNGELLSRATRPQSVAVVTLTVHLALGAVKLPAALLSGSVGLLNDALDTLLDALSSLVVFWGIQYRKETLANIVLCGAMFVTGAVSAAAVLRGLADGHTPRADPLAFVAVTVSALLCGLLWFYQRFSGLRHANLSLIAQSVDSRNHVLVAVSVGAALVSACFRIGWLDLAVGAAVALIILHGAVCLLLEISKGADEETISERYGFSAYRRFRRNQLKGFLLYLLQRDRHENLPDLRRAALEALDFEELDELKALGLDSREEAPVLVNGILEELQTGGEIGMDPFGLSESGRRALERLRLRSNPNRPTLLKLGTALLRLVRGILIYGLLLLLSEWLLQFLPDLFLFRPGYLAYLRGAPVPPSLRWCMPAAGALLYLLGRRLKRNAARGMRRSRHASDTIRLQQEGPYAHRRHPFYAGMILSVTGWALGLFSLWAYAAALLFLVLQLVQVRVEERKLEEEIPELYREYRSRVGAALFSPREWMLGALLAAVVCWALRYSAPVG